MAERKSVNKYYPPDWDPSKGSVNNYVGQHPLRDRAKKLGQGILVIRFEMPYNIWCGGCNSHIGMGVRYNAEKSKTGNYYSTPIYKFRMKCHLCDNYFEIQTDPKNHDYVILEGARRKEQRWDPKENEQIVPEDKATQKKMATDSMFKLEHVSDDVDKGKKVKSNLGLLEIRRDEWKDDYILNKIARNKFREEKKSIKAVEASDTALLTKSSLEIPLLKETEEDRKLAGLMKYRTVNSYEEKQTQKRKEIESRPLFTSSKVAKVDGDQHDSKKLDIIKTHLRTVNTLSHTSPFDRMKMNTLAHSSPLNKNNLGIRKKAMPSHVGLVKQRKTDSDCETMQGGNDVKHQSNVTETDLIEDYGQSVDNNKDMSEKENPPNNSGVSMCTDSGDSECHTAVAELCQESDKPNQEQASNSNAGNSSECLNCDKPDCDSTNVILKTNSSENQVSVKEAHSTHISENQDSTMHLGSECRHAVRSLTVKQDTVVGLSTADKVQQSGAVIVSVSANSGLSLVSTYSDSDTDSNTG